MKKSLVSIIVPCYNYGHLLHDALDSILAQTYKYWECIIVDDGSTDDTKAVAEKYVNADVRFKYTYQKNRGLSGARNTGLKIADGDYIQLLDADDYLPPDKITCHVAILDQQTEVDLVYGTVYIFERHLSAIGSAKQFVLQKPLSGTGEQVLPALIEDNIFLVHCALFRSSIISDVGFFNEDMVTCEDWNFWFRCAFLTKQFLFLDNYDSRVYVRSHEINMSKNRKNMWIGHISFRKEAAKLLHSKSGPIYKSIKDRNLHLLQVVNTRLSLAYGNMLSGMAGTVKIVLRKGDLFETIYDSLYWIKERVLRKV